MTEHEVFIICREVLTGSVHNQSLTNDQEYNPSKQIAKRITERKGQDE